MGRSRSSNRRAAPAPAPRRTAAPARAPAPAPATHASAPAPAPVQQKSGGMMSGLMGTVAEGMAWGTGTAVARHAVNAVLGGGSSSSDGHYQEAAPAPVQAAAPVQQQQQPNVCYNDQKSFLDCLNKNANDISACQFYLDQFNQCKQQAAYTI